MKGCLTIIVGGVLLLIVVLAAGLLAAPGDNDDQAAVTRSTPAPSASMFGSKYSVTVQERIDTMADHRDCAGLQDEFDIADANDAATRNRTGSGTADLMGYIDDAMRRVGCYG